MILFEWGQNDAEWGGLNVREVWAICRVADWVTLVSGLMESRRRVRVKVKVEVGDPADALWRLGC